MLSGTRMVFDGSLNSWLYLPMRARHFAFARLKWKRQQVQLVHICTNRDVNNRLQYHVVYKPDNMQYNHQSFLTALYTPLRPFSANVWLAQILTLFCGLIALSLI